MSVQHRRNPEAHEDELHQEWKQLQARTGIGMPDWVHDMMREQDRIYALRAEAGWEVDEGGWYSPCGVHESEWEHDLGNPFPEEPEYTEWAAKHMT